MTLPANSAITTTIVAARAGTKGVNAASTARQTNVNAEASSIATANRAAAPNSAAPARHSATQPKRIRNVPRTEFGAVQSARQTLSQSTATAKLRVVNCSFPGTMTQL